MDDDPFVTASLATILSAEPDIVVAGEGHDGEEAVALFERERPDVLLMDIQMPGVGGLEAAERILAAHPEARVVFLTTFSDDEYIVRALRLGAKGYLIKQEVATIAPALRDVYKRQLFGRGIANLCLGVRETGSLNASAKGMGMAYSKAWRIVKDTEAALGIQLLDRDGAHGSTLTEAGDKLLDAYVAIDKKLQEDAEKEFARILG